MSKHRKDDLPPHRLNPIPDALLPAVARKVEDGVIIVDVDDTLADEELDEAVAAALHPYQKRWLGVMTIPALITFGELVARAVREHQRTAAAVAGAAATAAAGIVALAAIDVTQRDGQLRPGVIAASTVTQTQTSAVEPTAITPLPSASSTTREPRPTREPTRRERVVEETRPTGRRVEPAFDGPPRRTSDSPTRRPAPQSPQPSRPAATSTPAPQRSRTASPVVSAREEPSTPAGEPDRPTTEAPDPRPQPDPDPPPTAPPSSARCSGIGLKVKLGELGVGVCVS